MSIAKMTSVSARTHAAPAERRAAQARALARGEYTLRVSQYDAERAASKRSAPITVQIDGQPVKVRPVRSGTVERYVGSVAQDVHMLAGQAPAWVRTLPDDLARSLHEAMAERLQLQLQARQDDALAAIERHMADARQRLAGAAPARPDAERLDLIRREALALALACRRLGGQPQP